MLRRQKHAFSQSTTPFACTLQRGSFTNPLPTARLQRGEGSKIFLERKCVARVSGGFLEASLIFLSLLTMELFYLQLPIVAFLLTVGASLLTVLAFLVTPGAFLLTVGKCI